MEYRILDMEKDPRREQFRYFQSLANPYVGTTVPVDVTAAVIRRRKTGESLFLSLLYCLVRAANAVPQLRRRLLPDGTAVEYEYCRSSHIVPLQDDAYCYCTLDCRCPWEEFLPYAQAEAERAKSAPSLDDGGQADLLFLSCVPWLSFTALVQPTPFPADSNPRIIWGKCQEENGRWIAPVALLAHHALVDGIHIARFYQALEEELRRMG